MYRKIADTIQSTSFFLTPHSFKAKLWTWSPVTSEYIGVCVLWQECDRNDILGSSRGALLVAHRLCYQYWAGSLCLTKVLSARVFLVHSYSFPFVTNSPWGGTWTLRQYLLPHQIFNLLIYFFTHSWMSLWTPSFPLYLVGYDNLLTSADHHCLVWRPGVCPVICPHHYLNTFLIFDTGCFRPIL